MLWNINFFYSLTIKYCTNSNLIARLNYMQLNQQNDFK